MPRRSFWAWGLESEEPTDEDRARRAEHLSKRFGVAITPAPVPDLADAEIPGLLYRLSEAMNDEMDAIDRLDQQPALTVGGPA